MKTLEKLKQIYEKGNNTLTTKELKDLGFTQNDITKLIKDVTIKRIKRGHYIVISTEYLMECFFSYLKSERYEEALKVLEMTSRLSKSYFHADYNTYLIILRSLITLPDNYYDYLNILEPNDLEIDPSDERIKDKEYQNRIREAIFNRNYIFAITLLFKNNEDNNRTENNILKFLIKKIDKELKQLYTKLNELIKNEQYESIVELLSARKYKYNPNLDSILLITQNIIEIRSTDKIPEIVSSKSKDLEDAIIYKNYALALSLSQDYNAKKGLKDDDNSLTLILKAIVNEIKKLQTLAQVSSSNEEVDNDNTYDKVLLSIRDSLEKREIPTILKYLKEYLTSINKLEYERLIILLIKLSFVRKSGNYEFIIDLLLQLRGNVITFNVTEIVKEYEISFKNNNTEKVEVIFDIIKELEKLGIVTNITSGLSTKKIENKTVIIEPKVEEPVIITPKKPTPTPKKEASPEIKDFMASLYNKLQEDSLIILDENASAKIDIEIFNKEYRYQAHAFKIGTNGLVVIKRIKYVKSSSEIMKKGDEAFQSENWEQAIEEYKELLPFKNTLTRAYANIGIAYMNLNNLPEAIKYLTIATGISELNPLIKHNYTKLINELKSKLTASIKKEDKYGIDNTDLNDYFGTRVKEVADLINQGQTLESACEQLNIKQSERNMIALLLARDCYAREYFAMGDEYVKQVENNPYKSKQVITFQDSLKQNRLLYHSKVNENYNPLLTPRKVENVETSKEEPTPKINQSNLNEKTESESKRSLEEDILERKYQELIKEGEPIILKAKYTPKFNIEEFNKRYKDAYAFYIGLGTEKRIVIKFISKRYINVKEIAERAKIASEKEDYDTVISENKRILLLKNAQPITYGAVGLAYLKKDNTNKALKYLEIATGLAQAMDITGYDYTEVINKIKGISATEVENNKEYVKMNVNEFSSDLNDDYGSKRLKEVIILMNFQGMSAKEACEALCIDIEETNKIFLVLAKECYALGEYEQGDRYLLEVERNSTIPTIKKLVSEIRTNKRFYKNRIDTDYKPLVKERTLRI